MNEQEDFSPEEQLNELIQLRFDSTQREIGDLNAAQVADVLAGLVEFTSLASKSGQFGSGPSPELRVRPTKEGSFIVEAVLQWVIDNPEGGYAIATGVGGGLVQGIVVASKKIRGAKTKDIEHLDNENVKITWQDDTVSEVSADLWKELNKLKNPTRKALHKMMAPLSDETDVLEVRSADPSATTSSILETDPTVVFERVDYRKVAPSEDTEELPPHTFTVDAHILTTDFRPYEKWRIKTLQSTRLATMADEDFQKKFNKGMDIHEADIFELSIDEDASMKNGRRSTDWTITEIRRKFRARDEGDGDGESSTGTEPQI